MNPITPVRNLVSTIIPVRNRPAMLAEAVQSVLGQLHRPIEVIIVDDASSDQTPAVAQELASDHPDVVHVIALDEPSGPGPARNLGLANARGEFVQYLDSDDLLEPGKFEAQVAALRKHPEAGLAYGLTRRIDTQTGTQRDWARTADDIDAIFPGFLMQRGWDTNSPLWRRSTCDAVGAWGDFRCMEDWEHDLRAGMLGFVPVRVDAHVATVRDHSGSRASGMVSGYNQSLARDLFRAHRSAWRLMQERGLTDWSYTEGFSRKFFWVARLCGQLGLEQEAAEALGIAENIASIGRRPNDIRAFRFVARLVGWRRAAAAGEMLRSAFRRNRGGSHA